MQLRVALYLEEKESVRTFNFLGYDIRQGFRRNKYKLLIILLIAVSSCIELYLYKRMYYSQTDVPQATYMDYLFFILRGRRPYDPETELRFIFPARWILIYLYLLYATLYYPYKDLLNSIGNHLLVLGRSRRWWWISKCIWNILFVMCYFAAIYAATFSFCIIMNEGITGSITESLAVNLMEAEFVSDGSMLAIYTVFVPVLTAIALSLLEMFLALFIKPFFGFCTAAVLLLVSSYFFSPWLIGNYAMPMRSVYALESGVTFQNGIFLNLAVIVCCILGGAKVFKNYDVISMTEM